MANRKKTLQGFGPVKSGQGLAECLKQVGTIIGNKGVRPVGGNAKGVTSANRGNVGDIKMKPIGGGKGIARSGGKGPKTMPDASTGVKLKTHEGMGKSGLPSKGVREQPD
jgi:hypothetical protein